MLKTRLFEIADERGIRYRWLAEKLGYTPEYLSRIKHGFFPITTEFQRRACTLFSDVPEDVLFFESNDERNHHSITTVEAAS